MIIALSNGPPTELKPTKKNYPPHECKFTEYDGQGAYTCPVCGRTLLGY